MGTSLRALTIVGTIQARLLMHGDIASLRSQRRAYRIRKLVDSLKQRLARCLALNDSHLLSLTSPAA